MVEARKILVTGVSGMLGRVLVSRLKKGYTVSGLDSKGGDGILNVDITDRENLLHEVSRINPEIIIHAAAYTDVDGCQLNPQKADMVNAQGTKNVAQACKEAGSFLVYISTDFVFDGKKETPYTENDKPSPLNIYGISKLKGEEFVQKTMQDFLIIRTSWMFGEGGKSFVSAIIDIAKGKKSLNVVNDQFGSPTYTKDLAGAIEMVIRRATAGILHITNSGLCSRYEYAKETPRLIGAKDVKLEPISSAELDSHTRRPKMSVLDNTRSVWLYGKGLSPGRTHWRGI